MRSLSKTEKIISWICRITATIILLQALLFKFTGAGETVYVFSQVGLEPWGRYGLGVAGLVAAVLLLTSRFVWAGAPLALGVITGALVGHLAILGIVVQNDGGRLFALAVIMFLCGVATAFLHRHQFPHPWRSCPTQKQ